MPEIDDDKSRRSRGWKRMRELDQQETADRLALEAELVADLGRRPTAFDRIAMSPLPLPPSRRADCAPLARMMWNSSGLSPSCCAPPA